MIDGQQSNPVSAWFDPIETIEVQRAFSCCRFIEAANTRGGWKLPDDFNFGDYLARSAAKKLKTVVTLEPVELFGLWSLVMFGYVMVDGLATVVDPNVDTTTTVLPVLFALSQLGLGVWSGLNIWRSEYIRGMLIPRYPAQTTIAVTSGSIPDSPGSSPPVLSWHAFPPSRQAGQILAHIRLFSNEVCAPRQVAHAMQQIKKMSFQNQEG